MRITKISISGDVLQVGIEPFPYVVIDSENYGRIKLALSVEEAKEFGKHLYETTYLTFDAEVNFSDL